MSETIFEKHLFNVYLDFSRLLHVPAANMEEVARHQGAMETIWLHFCRLTTWTEESEVDEPLVTCLFKVY